jgi:uncharacterized membrane protein
MDILLLLVVTGGIFLVGDAIMLPKVIKPLFERHLGNAILSKPRPAPATLFYVVYVAGVIWFAGLPAFTAGAPALAILNGALLGVVAYGTYELVSWTVMRDWHPSMVAADMTWGTFLSAVSAWGGVAAALAFG